MTVNWHKTKSLILLVAPFFLWGTAMVTMKGVIETSSPLFMAGLRIFPAGILLLLVTSWQKRPQPSTKIAWSWIILFALIDGTLFQGFLAQGLSRTGAGLGSVIIDSQPLVVALMSSWLFGEVIGLWGGLGLAVGILGISLIGLSDQWLYSLWETQSLEITLTWQSFLNSGEGLMLFASLSMAIGTILIRYIVRHVDPVVATGWHMVIGGVPLLLASAYCETQQWSNISALGWLSLTYSTIFGSALAYGLFFFLASSGNLTSLSSLTFLTPVFALSFGSIFLSEVLSPLQWIGVSLTILSIYLINQRQELAEHIAYLFSLILKTLQLQKPTPNR